MSIMQSLEQKLPNIQFSDLPVDERTATAELIHICSELVSFAKQMEEAVTLYEAVAAAAGHDRIGWLFVCARDGAVTLYHIGFLHEKLRASFQHCRTVREHSDHSAIRDAGRAFRTAFPMYEQLRHSVGHAAELSASYSAQEHNAPNEALHIENLSLAAGIGLRNALLDDVFTQTINGLHVGYEVSQGTLETVKGILDQTFTAIKTAAGDDKA